jgi:hypothetical protein
MNEVIELWILEENAFPLFDPKEGEPQGSIVRKVTIRRDDPRLEEIVKQQRRLRSERSFLFTTWRIRRSYTQEELERAELLQLLVPTVFEPAGEECGTLYDDTDACTRCGAGGVQVSELVLDLRKIPANRDFARTIADELIVSHRLARLIANSQVSGVELRPVRDRAPDPLDSMDLSRVPSGRALLEAAMQLGIDPKKWTFDIWLHDDAQRSSLNSVREESENESLQRSKDSVLSMRRWYQPVAIAPPLSIISLSAFGNDPFSKDSDSTLCENQDNVGLNQISEITVSEPILAISDYQLSEQYIGIRRGLLRPSRAIFISTHFYRLLRDNGIKGFDVQLVHLDRR